MACVFDLLALLLSLGWGLVGVLGGWFGFVCDGLL